MTGRNTLKSSHSPSSSGPEVSAIAVGLTALSPSLPETLISPVQALDSSQQENLDTLSKYPPTPAHLLSTLLHWHTS